MPDGNGMSESPFPTGAFGVFDVACSKMDENKGLTGTSEFEVKFKDGGLEVIPIAEKVVGDMGTIKTAIWKIEKNFKPDALPSGLGGVFRGKIVCGYNQCMVNECRIAR